MTVGAGIVVLVRPGRGIICPTTSAVAAMQNPIDCIGVKASPTTNAPRMVATMGESSARSPGAITGSRWTPRNQSV